MANENRERQIFQSCLELPPERREAHIQEACGGDEVQADRIRRLLDAHAQAEARTAGGFEIPADLVRDPARIGPYRIIQRLGEGGMGIVYEAEQRAPLRRRVALKIIKTGMDTQQVTARFEAERQALAVMNHPGIAKVLGAGATETGRPYFVMELVKGVPLLQYCDQTKAPLKERLGLCIELCRAVQHAHQKGVIHRDLKPSNILVSVDDGKPLPKIIDFGIAKAVGQRLTDQTLATLHGQTMGTPAYMSPEQAERSGMDVDARTDVYSLGVTLYELLVGALPFELTAAGIPAFVAALARREINPPKPSARFAALGDLQVVLARRRSTDPVSLRQRLEMDLDWIVMKAMEPERSRRYDTPSALAQDIQRCLDDEPVLARPPAALYRMGKFVRRHRTAVWAASLVGLALLAGAVGTTVGLVRATRAEEQARREARTAQETADFLVGLFEVSDPGEALGNTVTARELLDRGTARIGAELRDQPLVRAQLLETMSRVHRALGLYQRSEELARQALTLEESDLETDHPKLASTLHELGLSLIRLGRFEEAGQALQRSLQIRQRRSGEDSLEAAELLQSLGLLRWHLGRLEEAKELHRRVHDIRVGKLGPGHVQVAHSLRQLGIVAVSAGEFREALQLHESAHAIFQRELGPDHPVTADNLDSLGLVHADLGDHSRAISFHREALEIRRRVLGDNHPVLAYSYLNLARAQSDSGDLDAAGPLLETALRIREEALGPSHPRSADVVESLAILQARRGQLETAQQLFERSLATYEAAYGSSHLETLETLRNLALLSIFRQRPQAALGYLRRALDGGYAADLRLEEPVFDPLRETPEFKRLVEDVESALAAR